MAVNLGVIVKKIKNQKSKINNQKSIIKNHCYVQPYEYRLYA